MFETNEKTREEHKNGITWDRITRIFYAIQSYIGLDDWFAIIFVILGILGFINGPLPYVPVWTDIYINLRSEMIGIGVSVLIIANANEVIGRKAEKERLILQVGSPDRAFAVEAVRVLSKRGWLDELAGEEFIRADLEGADFYGANLLRTKLGYVNLQNANLCGVKMDFAEISNCNFEGAYLHKTSLVGAKFLSDNSSESSLKGADLYGANLLNAEFWGIHNDQVSNSQHIHLGLALRLESAIMPDGKLYDGRYNLEGDIRQAIALGINPEKPNEMAHFYKVDTNTYKQGQQWYSENAANILNRWLIS